MRFLACLVLSFWLSACVAATCRTSNVIGTWASRDRPVPIYVHPDVSAPCRIAIDEAVMFWAAHGVTYLEVPYLVLEGADPAIHIVPEPPAKPGAAGLMTGRVHRGTNQFRRVEVAIQQAWCTDAHVAAHELGHALGLNHANEPARLMWPTTDGGWGVSAAELRHVR